MKPVPEAPMVMPVGLVARGSARVPPSKSMAHRALILSALAWGISGVSPCPEGDDVAATMDCLRALGAEIFKEGPDGLEVRGRGGRWVTTGADLDCRASGTTLRLLASLCAAREGTYRLDGGTQLRSRPVGPLAEALRQMGATVTCLGREGFPPLRIDGAPWDGGVYAVDAALSSQFLSGLLLAAPFARAPVTFVAENLASESYARLTARMMDRAGVPVRLEGGGRWSVTPAAYGARAWHLEPDASASAFLFAASAVTGGEVFVRGIGRSMLQGDAVILDHLRAMGCTVTESAEGAAVGGPARTGITADMRACPDLVPPLAAVALFVDGPSRFEGVAHLRTKESDRLGVLAEVVRTLGGRAEVEADALVVVPTESLHGGVTIDPRGDHRMAMAAALAGLRLPDVAVDDPSCVEKSFPDFFSTLGDLLCPP